jgi:hypothetical protein
MSEWIPTEGDRLRIARIAALERQLVDARELRLADEQAIRNLQRQLAEAREVLFAYEMVLTEMRTHARADRTIAEWVRRLDFARDEHSQIMQICQALWLAAATPEGTDE